MIAHSRMMAHRPRVQLRRSEFEQRPGEKWQGCQQDDGVWPPIGSTATKQHRQGDDKARVGQEGVRYDPRQRDVYSCIRTQCECQFLTSISAAAAAYAIKIIPSMYIDTETSRWLCLSPEGVGVGRRLKTQIAPRRTVSHRSNVLMTVALHRTYDTRNNPGSKQKARPTKFSHDRYYHRRRWCFQRHISSRHRTHNCRKAQQHC